MTTKIKKNVVYDIETFKNFFSVCFYELDTKEYKEFVIFEDRNDLEALRVYWINVGWKIGFNNHRFDDVIMRFIMDGGDRVSPSSINNIAQIIINTQKRGDSLYKEPYLMKYLQLYDDSVDLMKIHALHKAGVSLKQVGVVLNHPKLQDLPKDPYADIYPEELNEILKYGRNDVDITRKLFEYSKADIKLRKSISEQYKVNLISESRTYIAKKILDKYYEQITGDSWASFKELRSYYKQIPLKDIVKSFKFKTRPLQELYTNIKSTIIDKDSKFEPIVQTKEMKHKLGLGGLHSQNKNEIYESNDEYAIIDIDFGSYYPNLMLKYKLYPKHLKPDFLKVLKTLTEQRLEAKRTGDKITADTLKISINSLFGLLGFDQYWLKDDSLMYSVTVNGQLLLLALIEDLEYLGDVTCIYSNTDGATFKVDRNILNKFMNRVNVLSEAVGIEIDAVNYKKMILRDVNNYLIIIEDNKVKLKGAFLYEQNITKGFKHPIIQKALNNYYIKGIPAKDTIENETDIYLFCIAQRTGKQFQTYYRTINGMTKLQKTNRYFVSTNSGSLIKVKDKEDGTTQENQAVAGENVYILNDYDESKDKEYLDLVKRSYYIKETNKIIDSFKVNQLKLF